MIASDYFWLNIVFLFLGTIAIRFSFIAMSSRVVISSRTKELFSFIPSAVLPAMIAPNVFFHKGAVEIMAGKERFVVLILATLVCYWGRNTLLTIGFGLVSLYVFRTWLHF
jgi:branched-subunit amino acid transport protein